MSDSSSDDDAYGPALPPHLLNLKTQQSQSQNKEPPKLIGPQLPPSLMKKLSNDSKQKYPEVSSKQPSSSTNNDDDDEDDGLEIGPYLPDDPRSLLIPTGKVIVPESELPTKREEWMLVCPKNKSIAEAVGLGPRKFLAKTPDEPRAKRNAEDEEDDEVEDFIETARAELEAKREKERDDEMADILKSGSSRNESLLSLHQKKRKIQQGKDDDQPKERRPFDRDIDLKVNGLSDKDKDKFIKKCGELSGRFKGGKKKFL